MRKSVRTASMSRRTGEAKRRARHPVAVPTVDDRPPAAGHNRLVDYAETIRSCHVKARTSSKETLLQMRRAGKALIAAKAAMKHGEFEPWCVSNNFRFDKSWRARLMRLAKNWNAIHLILEADPDNARLWTVAGALSAFAATRQKKPRQSRGDTVRRLTLVISELRERIEELERERNNDERVDEDEVADGRTEPSTVRH